MLTRRGLTSHSSRTRFAGRLNSGVSRVVAHLGQKRFARRPVAFQLAPQDHIAFGFVASANSAGPDRLRARVASDISGLRLSGFGTTARAGSCSVLASPDSLASNNSFKPKPLRGSA